jgi:WD40 repeat protein
VVSLADWANWCAKGAVSAACPHAEIVATLHQAQILLHSSVDGRVLRSIPLDAGFAKACKTIRWFQGSGLESAAPSTRFLVADDDNIHVYDLHDSKWHAGITGAASNTGRIANVEFGATQDEVLVFADFGLKLTIWSLATGKGVEVRDPKFPRGGHSLRRSGHVAVLTRAAAKDSLVLLNPGSGELVSSFESATLDAQGVEWSPDGKWLAVVDAQSAGCRLLVYTASGTLFKTWSGNESLDNPSLGIRKAVWHPKGEYLAVAMDDGHVTLLASTTFTALASLVHSSTITATKATLYQEEISAASVRSYTAVSPPTSLPAPQPTQTSTHIIPAVTNCSFDPQGNVLATISAANPTSVWLWSLGNFKPLAILIHHSPIKSLQWHPSASELLLIHCAISQPLVHLWSSTWQIPRILDMPLEKPGIRTNASFVTTPVDSPVSVMLDNSRNLAVRSLATREEMFASSGMTVPAIKGFGPEDAFDEGNSMDLSPVKFTADDFLAGGAGEGETRWNMSDSMDDTFDFRKKVEA